MTEARTAQISVRLHAREKELLGAASERFGMDASTVTRQLIELVCQRLTSGDDLIDVLYAVKNALAVETSAAAQNGIALAGPGAAVGRNGPANTDPSLTDRIDRLEAELRKRSAG